MDEDELEREYWKKRIKLDREYTDKFMLWIKKTESENYRRLDKVWEDFRNKYTENKLCLEYKEKYEELDKYFDEKRKKIQVRNSQNYCK